MGHFFGGERTNEDGDGSGEHWALLPKKRKSTGKVPKGEDYWSKAEIWFAEKVARWGLEIKSRGWQE